MILSYANDYCVYHNKVLKIHTWSKYLAEISPIIWSVTSLPEVLGYDLALSTWQVLEPGVFTQHLATILVIFLSIRAGKEDVWVLVKVLYGVLWSTWSFWPVKVMLIQNRNLSPRLLLFCDIINRITDVFITLSTINIKCPCKTASTVYRIHIPAFNSLLEFLSELEEPNI